MIQRADKSARRGQMTLRTNEQRIHADNSQAVASKRPNRWKAAQIHCSWGRCKLKAMMSCHFITRNLGKTNKTNNKSYWWDSGKRWVSNYWGESATASGEIKLATATESKSTQTLWPGDSTPGIRPQRNKTEGCACGWMFIFTLLIIITNRKWWQSMGEQPMRLQDIQALEYYPVAKKNELEL